MKGRIPFAVAVPMLLGQLVLTYRSVLARTGGTYCYPVDDAFIQLSIARHVAFDGVYGVTKHVFSAASSSILWPLLLAAIDRVAGDRLLTPLVLNGLFAVALVAFFNRLLDRGSASATWAWRLFWVCALVLLTPLPTLVLTGMEHVLHAFATVWLVTTAARWLGAEGPGRPKELAQVALGAAVTCAARYEGLFTVALIVMLALARRRWSLAGAAGAAGAMPVLAFGAYSRVHGGMLLPNSVLLKGRSLVFRDLTDVGDFFFGDLVHRLSTNSHLLVLGGATLVLCLHAWRREGLWSAPCCALGIAAFTTLTHVQMAGLGWFFRYDAYLVALDIVVIGLALTAWVPSPWAALAGLKPRAVAAAVTALATVVILGPLLKRALEAAEWTATACVNIYEQQVQIARFLAKYFANDTVAINDIGAVTYYGDERIVDVMGIATMEAARAKSFKLHEPMSRGQMARITRSATVAIVYDEWVGSTPSYWLGLGRWRIDDNRVCGFPAVSIYAATPDDVPRVIEALRSFSTQLPSSVHQEGRYTQPDTRDELYRLDTGDVLDVRFSGAYDLGGTLWVRDDGSIEFPKIGSVIVRGMSLREAVDGLNARIAGGRYSMRIPRVEPVDFRLLQERDVRTYAVGDVLRPGEFSTTTAPTVDFLLRVSGANVNARGVFILHQRGAQFQRVPLEAARAEGRLEHGDILVVR
jgi:protein involved in polysaccharide export with SLBB domain